MEGESMSEWKEVRLGDVGKIVGGATPSTRNPQNYGGVIPWITPKDLSINKERFIEFGERNISELGLNSCSAKMLPKGSILFSSRAPIGYVAIAHTSLCTNQGFKSFVPDTDKMDSMFSYYLLKHNSENIANLGSGTTFMEVSGKVMSDFIVNIPDLLTQQEIAGILSSLDAKIETNNKLNEKLEEMAQAIFKSWFVDFEPFKDKPFHETELGMIPEGWEVGSLSDIATITMGQSPCGTSYNENGEGIIFYQGRTEFGFRFPSVRLYTTAPSRFAEVGSTLMSVRAPVGDINMALLRCCIGRGVASIKSNCDCDSYIYYLMKSLKKRFDIYNGEGTVFGSVGRDTLRGLLITIPPSSVISDFEMNISKIDSRIKTNELESKRLASLRDTLLPRLMSGELIL